MRNGFRDALTGRGQTRGEPILRQTPEQESLPRAEQPDDGRLAAGLARCRPPSLAPGC
jgi:hypothetical protein